MHSFALLEIAKLLLRKEQNMYKKLAREDFLTTKQDKKAALYVKDS